MGSIGRYIFRTTSGAFLVVLVSVTTLMWITQALRNFDLMTNQGQSVLVFVGITGLIIPMLVMIIAPIALMIAVAHVLTKMGNDSELIVMNAAGMDPWRVFRIMGEFVEGFDELATLSRGIAIFGSARTGSDDPDYQAAQETAALLAAQGFAVITGGGPGIMEAANRGAFEAGGMSLM